MRMQDGTAREIVGRQHPSIVGVKRWSIVGQLRQEARVLKVSNKDIVVGENLQLSG